MKIFANENTRKKIIYFGIIVVVFFLLIILFSLDLMKGSDKVSKSSRGKSIASVGGYIVYEGDLKDRLSVLAPEGEIKLEELPENILKAMVLEVVVNHKIDQEASKLKYQKDKVIKELVENYKKGLMREKFLNEKIYSKISDKDALKEYDTLIKNITGKEERKIKHILVESEDEIERVRRNVLRTGNFEKIAKEKSIDAASGENGGDIGYVLKEELVPEFGDMAFILKVGEISKPVKSQYGWHIVKVEDVRAAQFLPFEEVKESIKQRLQQQVIQDYLLSLTKDLKVDFKIKTKKLPDAEQPIDSINLSNNIQEEFIIE